jgi:hypothetical protein
MKLSFLRLNSAIKSSPISEGVTEIRISYYLARDKPDNMTLVSHEDTTRGHSSWCDQGDDSGTPHPSARLPRNTVTGIRGWPMHYPDVHPLGMVG